MTLHLDPSSLEAATTLQNEIGLVDLHVDCIIQQRLFRYDVRRRHRAKLGGQPLFWHADIPRMLEAGYRTACLGIHYWPWESEGAWAEMNRQIDYCDAIASNDPQCVRIHNAEDYAKATQHDKLALLPGVEGAHMLNGRLERVEDLARRKVAYLTLTHFSKNRAATPSMGRGANETDGLSDFGRDLVRACQAHGIIVDLAHSNTPTVLDACEIAEAPLFCTHTGVKGVHPHARNITDREIDAIRATGGVIGIMFAPVFMASSLRADTTCVLDHLTYVIQRAGIDHVALGSDYDGWLPTIPSDMRDCRDINRVTAGLMQRGYDRDDLEKILRHNALRLLTQN